MSFFLILTTNALENEAWHSDFLASLLRHFVICFDLVNLIPLSLKHAIEEECTGNISHLVYDCPEPKLENDLFDIPLEEKRQHNLLTRDNDA